jgi:hypothetical protein
MTRGIAATLSIGSLLGVPMGGVTTWGVMRASAANDLVLQTKEDIAVVRTRVDRAEHDLVDLRIIQEKMSAEILRQMSDQREAMARLETRLDELLKRTERTP